MKFPVTICMRPIWLVAALIFVAASVASAQQTPAATAPAQQATAPKTAPVAAPVAATTPSQPPLCHLSAANFANFDRYSAANAALPAKQKGRVVFFGDSITDNWQRNPDGFFRGKPYVDRGISGQTTPQMLLRFRQDVVALHPEAVVILAGTNDIAGNTGPTSLLEIANNLQSMAEIASSNGIHVILASVLPVADYPWHKGQNPAPKIKILNDWQRELCGKLKLTYLDYYSAMSTAEGGMKPELSKDGVHPNPAGYAIMTPLAEKAISLALNQ
jgi:lysophospholipase L1-like esterase